MQVSCRILVWFFTLFTLTVLVTTTLWAQGGTGELTGLVTDASSAVIANASVTLTNTATGEKRLATTRSAGTYRFPDLRVVGNYNLEIAAKGFRGYRIADIIISVGVITVHDAKLEIGTSKQGEIVEAGAQQVQTQQSSISGLVDRVEWQQMPLETRSQNEFIDLLAGAEPAAQAELVTDRGAAVDG
ncbi:MAG: carboxypeptidase-like regulatory domain-containing protein, partial [Candidatus Sulfotelmatobacter sp.]